MKTIKVMIVGLLAMTMTGCGFLSRKPEPRVPEVRIITEQVALPIFHPPVPAEIRLEDVRWHIITKDNLEQKTAEIERLLGGDFVVFAIVPQDYENMAYNLQEILRYLRQQNELLIYYRKATENATGTSAEDWLRINEETQQRQRDALESVR
jgi:hypothetical protein